MNKDVSFLVKTLITAKSPELAIGLTLFRAVADKIIENKTLASYEKFLFDRSSEYLRQIGTDTLSAGARKEMEIRLHETLSILYELVYEHSSPNRQEG